MRLCRCRHTRAGLTGYSTAVIRLHDSVQYTNTTLKTTHSLHKIIETIDAYIYSAHIWDQSIQCISSCRLAELIYHRHLLSLRVSTCDCCNVIQGPYSVFTEQREAGRARANVRRTMAFPRNNIDCTNTSVHAFFL